MLTQTGQGFDISLENEGISPSLSLWLYTLEQVKTSVELTSAMSNFSLTFRELEPDRETQKLRLVTKH